MGVRDPRFDEYIEKAAPFARPILSHLREVVHGACPEVVEEWKWSSPHFTYKSRPLAHMAAFKQHCGFGFWKGSLVVEPGDNKGSEAAGQFGRLTSLDDLPPDEVLAGYVRQAMELTDSGAKAPPRPTKHPKPDLATPDDLAAALARNPAAQASFDGFSPSQRREYLEWITDAKSEATRAKRLEQAVEWMSEGKARHWKYAKK
jgi:uncharacterized protein YdeI (YjbR/CyaY-like superfamily)